MKPTRAKQSSVRLYFYQLVCEDAGQVITGARKLTREQLVAACARILKALPDDEVLEPQEDWFETVVEGLCERLDFQRLHVDHVVDVEELYFAEVSRRSEEE